MNVLVISPHADDAEFACGGTMAKFVSMDFTVHHVVFTALDSAGTDTAMELRSAMKALRVPMYYVYDFLIRSFHKHRQEILDKLIRIRDEFRPDLVLCPSVNDTHQDHLVIANECFRAFKRCSIWGYELPWNNLQFSTNAFVALREQELKKKIKAISCYITQNSRRYSDSKYIESWARMRGVQIGVSWAEAFEVVRWVMR